MKDFILFNTPDFVFDKGINRWLHKKRKIDTNFRDKRLTQNPGKYIVVTEVCRILELPGTEQKMINEAEKLYEIERLMQAIRARGKLL